MTITEFLTARLDEDEALAREAEPKYDLIRVESYSQANEDHARRHDPARVLAEVEAKRRIVAYREQDARSDLPPVIRDPRLSAFDAALRALALPYASHDDYDEAWRV